MEKLSRIWEYLGTSLSNHTPSEDDQYVLQRLSKEVNGNIFTYRLYFSYDQTVSQATYQNFEAEIRLIH